MSIFSFFTLLGGLAFFLYGMSTMSTGLEKMAGGKLETIIKKMTCTPLKGIVLGAVITIAIQSSSAMTVMLVGLVNSGLMELGQTIGVIMGSNIGTTLTAWILGLSLTGGKTDNMIMRFLSPDAFSPILALIGVMMIMLKKSAKKKALGSIFIGFSILMYGMTLMSASVSPLGQDPAFTKLLIAFRNPLLGVVVGTVFTGIIQSSAASVSILQALSITGNITYSMAIPIIMGQNIGTCVTALISSIGVNKNAKRVACIHITFNIIGTVVWLSLYFIVKVFLDMSWVEQGISPFGIAACHTVFNVGTTAMLLPFTKLLEKIACCFCNGSSQDEEKYEVLLDERLMEAPTVALGECRNSVVKMGEIANSSLKMVIQLFRNYDEKKLEEIDKNELLLDRYEDQLGSYLVKLSSKSLTEEASKEISLILHIIGDFERIGDHVCNIRELVQEYHEKRVDFSIEAKKQLKVLTDATREVLRMTLQAYETEDIELAKKVEPLEQVIDSLKYEVKRRHVERVRKGECTIEQGVIFLDLLMNYERISDHCSNIAVCIIKKHDREFEPHKYLHQVREGENSFKLEYKWYTHKYDLDKE